MANNSYTNWVCRCLATGLNAYSPKDGLRPFLLAEVSGRVERRNIIVDTDQDALNQARQLVAALPAETEAYGIVWFQALATHGLGGPAILVEAACRGDQDAQIWARRFSIGGFFGKLASPPTSVFFGVRVANAFGQVEGNYAFLS